MPRQQKVSARMDFFEGYVFHEGNSAVPVETASLFAHFGHSNEYIASIF